jgi:hypothetical protein
MGIGAANGGHVVNEFHSSATPRLLADRQRIGADLPHLRDFSCAIRLIVERGPVPDLNLSVERGRPLARVRGVAHRGRR